MTELDQILGFLRQLRQNNNHEWFDAHREDYRQSRTDFEEFIQGLILHFDPIEPLGDLKAKECIHRIHNDMRFSRGKPPYKDNFTAVLAQGGRHSTKLPYYINITPDDGSLLAGGAKTLPGKSGDI